MRVLVAEDNTTNQLVAVRIANKLGCQADAVANGQEAIEALRTVPYDVVLMDCQMPEMDGFEATRRIRSGTAGVLNHTVPIIALTARVLDDDRTKCLAAGMNDFLIKPLDPEALAQAFDRLRARRRAQPFPRSRYPPVPWLRPPGEPMIYSTWPSVASSIEVICCVG